MEKKLHLYNKHKRRVTDIHLIWIKNNFLKDHLEIEKKTTFRNKFSHRSSHFRMLILDLIDAVF